jgi:hypothetical protein
MRGVGYGAQAGVPVPLESKALQRQSQKSRQDAGATREKADPTLHTAFCGTRLLQLQRHFLSKQEMHENRSAIF